MRRFRAFLFCVLAMAIPLQGVAHVALPLSPCPMEQLRAQDVSAMDTPGLEAMSDMSVHDCCPDADTAKQTGKTCKPGQSCQTLGSFFPVSAHLLPSQNPASAVRFASPADVVFSFEPAATWRPPAFN